MRIKVKGKGYYYYLYILRGFRKLVIVFIFLKKISKIPLS